MAYPKCFTCSNIFFSRSNKPPPRFCDDCRQAKLDANNRRFYQKNKEKINQKRREKYLKDKLNARA